MSWGSGGLKSCNGLLTRVENNDPLLKELVVLPMKAFGETELDRLAAALASGKNTNLKALSASGHKVPPASIAKLGAAIASSNVTSIAIGDETMGNEGVEALCSPLASSHGGQLQVLDLAWKGVSKEGMAALGKTFGPSQNLVELNLARNQNMGNDGMIAFCESARGESSVVLLGKLCMLDLADCSLGAEGVTALANILLSGDDCSRSLALTLSANPLGVEACRPIASLLCGEPSCSSSIMALYLARCELGDEGMEALARSIGSRQCTGLELLDLSYNNIGPAGARVIAESLWNSNSSNDASKHKGFSCWNTLVELKLAGNPLEREGVLSLTTSLVRAPTTGETVLEGNTTLEAIDLSDTNCSVDGAVALLHYTLLKRLRLFNNKLGSQGMVALSKELFDGHASLEELDLGGNNAGKESILELLNSIATFKAGLDASRLRVLEIGGNETSFEVEEAIKRIRTIRPELDIARDKPRQQDEE